MGDRFYVTITIAAYSLRLGRGTMIWEEREREFEDDTGGRSSFCKRRGRPYVNISKQLFFVLLGKFSIKM